MHTCINTCTHTYTYIHTHTHVHTYIHTYIHTYMHAYIHIPILTYIYTPGGAVADLAVNEAFAVLSGAPPNTMFEQCKLLNETVCEASHEMSRYVAHVYSVFVCVCTVRVCMQHIYIA